MLEEHQYLIAMAEGYGPQWVLVGGADPREDLKLTLTPATSVIEGRVVDLEGQPVSGVRVRPHEIRDPGERLDEWIEQAKQNPATISDWDEYYRPSVSRSEEKRRIAAFPPHRSLKVDSLPMFPETVTDAKGRFRISGMGDDRMIVLRLDGAGIASTWVKTVTRDIPVLSTPDFDPRYRVGLTFGVKFDYAAEPAQPVVGTVRDAYTGEPLSGARVMLNTFANSKLLVRGYLSAITDAEGRFELAGLPKPKSQGDSLPTRLVVWPDANDPYFRSEVRVPLQEGIDPISVDVKLKRAIWLTGRVTNQATGEPVRGLVSYFPFLDNPHAQHYANFHPGRRSFGHDGQYATDDDGRYRIPALPGRGIVRVIAEKPMYYQMGVGADDIAGLLNHKDNSIRGIPRLNVYHLGGSEMSNSIAEVTPTDDARELEQDMEVVPFGKLQLRLLDPAGQPLLGVQAAGRFVRSAVGLTGGSTSYWDQLPDYSSNIVEIVGLADEFDRPIMVYHPARTLAAVLPFDHLDRDAIGPQAVTLQPCATITGRITAADGKPLDAKRPYVQAGLGGVMEVYGLPGRTITQTLEHRLSWVDLLDEEGNYEYVVPGGAAWTLMVGGFDGGQVIAEDLQVAPGERIDLGAIDIDSDPATWPKPQRTAATTSTTPLSGEGTPNATEGAAKPLAVADADQTTDGDVTFHYRGRIVNPDGQPVADARMYFVYWVHGTRQQRDVEPVALSDADGWFDFTATPADIGAGAESAYASNFSFPLVAIADGYGFAEQLSPVFETTGNVVDRLPAAQREYYEQRFKGAEPVLWLAKDDVPIRGRVVNTEGQPVAGVRVAVDRFWYNDESNLDAWEGAAKEDKADFYSLRQHTPHITNGPQMRSVIPDVTTDADGRFTLRGIGRERIVQVLISGPGIETNQVKARTRDGEMIEVPNTSQRERGPDNRETYHPAEFTHVAAASIPVIGRITDADSGEPITDVTVSAGQSATFLSGGKYWITTSTDADGRYRLEGLPIGSAEDLYVLPPDDSPYLPASRRVKTRLGEDADAQDFVLKQGLWVRGQAVDARTGEPLPGRAQYYVDSGNPHLEEYAAFARGYVIHERRADVHGRFAIPVLPGRGIVTFMPDDPSKYRRGVGAETITIPGEIFDVKRQSKSFKVKPSMLSSGSEAVLHEINPPVDSEPLEIVLRPVSGMEVVGKLLDPDGRPLTEGRIQVVGAPLHYPRFDTNQHVFRLEAYFPDEPCEVFFFHVERNLAGSLRLEGEPPESLTVTLHPAGGIRGRLVDDAGIPLSGVSLTGEGIPTQNYGDADLRLATDDEGRFHIRGLIPGRKYTVEARGDRLYGRVLIDESVDTPETKNVGDVTLQPPDRTKISPSPAAAPTPPKQPASRKTSSNASEGTAKPQAAAGARSGDRMILRGHVIGPDGKPVEGARVWMAGPPRVSQNWSREPQAMAWLVLARSDKQGRFRATVDRARLEAAGESDQHVEIRLAATANGLGFGWTDVKVSALDDDITVQLVEDIPIEGRILTVDGQPAVGVAVAVCHIPTSHANVDGIVKSASLSSGVYTNWPAWSGGSPETTPVTSDADGRFRLEGQGAGRVVRLQAHGGGIGATRLSIITHPTPDELRPHGTIAVREGLRASQYFAEFTHIAQPGRTIRGAVTDAQTGRPISGVRVTATSSWASRRHPAITGEDGRYEITGVPRADERYGADFPIEFRVDDSLHLNRDLRIEATAGQEPLEADVMLTRGITLRGRVTEGETGKPVTGTVIYNALYPNETVIQMDNESVANPLSSTTIRDDGTYELCVLPGPGAIAASIDGGPYLSATVDRDRLKELVDARGFEMIARGDFRNLMPAAGGQSRGIMSLSRMQAAALLNPAEGDETLTIDLQVVRGRTLTGTILDDDGQPLTGVRVIGLEPSGIDRSGPLETAEFTVEGLAAGQQRTLFFVHPDRKLGARLVIDGDEMTPPTVKLSPTASVTGRFVDKLGDPLPVVDVSLSLDLGFSSLGTDLWASVDESGRFRIDGLIADCDYNIRGQIPEQPVSLYVPAKINLRPGANRDLGVFVQKDKYSFTQVQPANETRQANEGDSREASPSTSETDSN